MTTVTISTYYCTFCEAVKTRAIKFGKGFINITESIGRARAAAELSRMGYQDEAKALMLGDTK